ncbi:hypothetical protein TWF281_011032 [Arthrobotrys megalospora]
MADTLPTINAISGTPTQEREVVAESKRFWVKLRGWHVLGVRVGALVYLLASYFLEIIILDDADTIATEKQYIGQFEGYIEIVLMEQENAEEVRDKINESNRDAREKAEKVRGGQERAREKLRERLEQETKQQARQKSLAREPVKAMGKTTVESGKKTTVSKRLGLSR